MDCISQFASLVVIDALKDGHGGQEVFVPVTLVLSGILNDVIEGITIKLPKSHRRLCNNCSCSRRIIQKCKLTKGITSLVCLQKCWLCGVSIQALAAVKFTIFNDEKNTASLTLGDNSSTLFELLFFHSINYNVELFRAKCLEHESHLQSLCDLVFNFLRFGNNIWYVFLLLVELAVNLS